MATDDEPLAAEPLFRRLHAEHPDVDVVVLPPVSTAPPDRFATPEEARQFLDLVRGIFDTVLAAAAVPSDARSEAWVRGSSAHWHRRVCRASLRGLAAPNEVSGVLARLTAYVEQAGWHQEESSATLAASADGYRLEVDGFAEAVDLVLYSAYVPVADEVLDALDEA